MYNESNNVEISQEIIDRFENAKETIDRDTLLAVAQTLNIHYKNGSEIFLDENMWNKSGKNKNPKIINIDNILENLNLDKKGLIKKAIDISSGLYINENGYSLFNNIDTDTDFLIKKSGISDTFSAHKIRDITKLNTANKLSEIGEQSIYFTTTQSPEDVNKIKYHHFLTPVKAYNKIGNAFIHSVIREFPLDRTQKNSFYYHQFEYLDNNKKEGSQVAPEKNIGIQPLENTPFSKNNIPQSNANVKSDTSSDVVN